MKDETIKHNNKLIFSVIIIVCLIVGFLHAFLIAQDAFDYINWAFTVVSIIFGIPLLIMLVIAATICFDSKNYKVYGFALLLSCVLLPVVSIASLRILEATKIAKYKISGFGEMRPIGSELNERIVIAFKEKVSQEEVHKFDEAILRKTVPQPNGILLDFADGVCGIAYPNTEFKYKIADVGFCNDATDEQKKKIRDSVNSSPIIYNIFENLRMEDIKKLPLEKEKIKTETSAISNTIQNKSANQTSSFEH